MTSPAPPTPPLNSPLPPDISIIHAFAQISATVLDLDDVLGTALDILAHAFNFDLLSIILVDDASNELQLKAYKSPHPVGILEAAYPAVLEAVEEGQVVKKTALTAGHGPVARLSSLVLPLTIGRLVTGALVVGDSQATTFSPQDEQILAIFASQLTVAITNVRLYQKSREQQQQELIRRQIATHLQQLSTIINASLEPDEVLNSILEHIAIVIPYSKALIMLLQGHNLVVHAAAGAAGDVIDMAVNVTEQTFYQQILLQQYPAVFHNITHDNPLTTEPVRFTEDTTAWIGAPLVIKDKLVGLLTLHHTEPGYFDDADLDLVHTFANQAAIAIDNAQLYHREQQKAKQFQTVAKIGRQATEIREVQLLLDTVVKRLHQDLGYEYVTMFLYQNQTDSLMLKAASDIPPEKIDAASRPISLDGPGILSTAGRTEQAILVNDINAFSGYYPGPGRDTVQSELAIPLISQEKLIGVLDFQSRRSHAFSPDDLTLAQAVADHMAVVIETANLFEERDQRMAELIAFNQIGIAIADPTNLDGTLASILERIKALYQVEGTSLMLLEGETLHFQIAVGVPEEVLKPFSLKLGEGFAGWVAQHNSPLRVDDVSKDPRHYKTIDQSINFKTRALLAVPVQIQGRVLGVIEVINRLDGKKFTRDDEVILSFIASAMAITIENSRLLANVTQKANQMAGLFEASQALTNLNLDKVLQITIRQAVNLLQTQAATLYMVDNARAIVTPGPSYSQPGIKLNPQPSPLNRGTVGQMIVQKRPLRVNDLQHSDLADNYPANIQNLLCVPLIAPGGVIGVIETFNKQNNRPFTAEDEAVMTALSSQAAIAIYNAQLHQETERRLTEVSTLYTLAHRIAASLEADRLLEDTTAVIRLALNCQGCSIFLLEEEQLLPGARNDVLSEAGYNYVFKCAQTLTTITSPVNYPTPDDFPPCDATRPEDLNSLLIVPLRIHGRLMGSLAVYHTSSHAFGSNEGRLLTIVATQVATALENSNLFNNLQQHAKNLEQALADLQELHRLQGEFVQNVSHELRTPLTFVKGYVDLILEESLGPVPEAIKTSLEIVARRTTDLNRLVSDIITHQQLEMNVLHFKETNLTEIINVATRSAKAIAAKSNITLTVDVAGSLPKLMADPDRIGQVFDNLIGNAIKFTGSGGRITVTARANKKGVKVAIKDTGIGIAQADLGKIFNRFYQTDGSTTRRFGGTGLGLTIVKQIIEAHHGTINVTSEPNKGSKFTFTLPIKPPVPAPEEGRAAAT